MKYTIYNPNTGKIQDSVTFANQEIADLNLNGKSYISGLYNEIEYYIKDGQAIKKDPDPSTTDIIFHFDYNTKQWVKVVDFRASNIRQQRDQLLTQIDNVNPIWYASLSSEQQTQLQVYRQDLLSVPQQSGFPESVDWPAKPTWL